MQPVMTIILGSITQTLIAVEKEGTMSPASQKQINHRALYLLFLAMAIGLGNFVSLVSWNYSGLNIIFRTRTRYFESVLRQDVTYLDNISAAEITTQLWKRFRFHAGGPLGEDWLYFVQLQHFRYCVYYSLLEKLETCCYYGFRFASHVHA